MDRVRKLNPFDPKERSLRRMMLDHARDCKVDSNKRILIPNKLVEFYKFGKEVIIVGDADRMELWRPEDYAKIENTDHATFAALQESIFGGDSMFESGINSEEDVSSRSDEQ